MESFDLRAGHIALSHGPMPITGIDWPALIRSLNDTDDADLDDHFLYGIEPRGISLRVDFYMMRADLKLHTDLTMHPGMTTLGVIVAADPDLLITTGQNSLPAQAGDVYHLDPTKRHGTRTKGFLAFATQDYLGHQIPPPGEFRAIALTELTKLLDFRGIGYQTDC